MSDWSGGTTFYRVTVKGLISNDAGQILMVSEDGGDLSLPGGGWDHGETLHECLMREMYEEIALTSDFTERPVCAIPRWLDTKQAWLLWLVYDIQYDALEFSLGEHGSRVEWVDADTIKATSPGNKMILEAMQKRKELYGSK